MTSTRGLVVYGTGRTLAVVMLAAALFLPAGRAAALDLGQWVPGLRVTPFLSERIEYESNVFQTPDHAQDDVIFKTIPGFLIEYGTGPNWLSLGYRAEILNFVSLSNQDAVHHIFLGQFHYEFTRLVLDLKNNFVKTTDPPTSELTGRIESTTNTLLPSAEYRVTSRLSIGANAEWTRVRFPTIPQLDRDEYLGGVSAFWKVLPKTDLRLNYNYGIKEFDSDPARDVTRHVVLLALRGDLTAKLSSTFRIGYEDRQPTHDRPGRVGYSGLIAGGDWTYRPTERTTIALQTDRSVQESIFANTLYYVQTLATLVVAHQFNPKLAGNARVLGGLNDYPVKALVDPNDPLGNAKFRQDDLVGWGAGVSYDIQPWLRVGADFIHITRFSNFRQFRFKDDKVVAAITLTF